MSTAESKARDLLSRIRAEAESIEQRIKHVEEEARPHYQTALSRLREYEAEAEKHLKSAREGSSEQLEHLKEAVEPAVQRLGEKMHDVLARLKS